MWLKSKYSILSLVVWILLSPFVKSVSILKTIYGNGLRDLLYLKSDSITNAEG
jgi:hypothetical protein